MLPSPLPRLAPAMIRALSAGFVAGLFGGLLMLIAMAALRLFYGVPTPTEMTLDRLFPLVTTDFFMGALARAGSYRAFKLDYAVTALAAQWLAVAVGGSLYAGLRLRSPKAAGAGVFAGVLAATAASAAFLWPNLLTSYRGLPPGRATVLSILGLLLSFAVGGLGIVGTYPLLSGFGSTDAPAKADRELSPGRRAFLASAIGTGLGIVLGTFLQRLYRLGTFSYDAKTSSDPHVRRITPIQPDDEFYQVTKNLVDPDPARSLWRLEIGGQVDTPRAYTLAEITALPRVTQETTLLSVFYRVGSGLCSNARWTGVPLVTLLDQVKPWGDNAAILFHAADGYYETLRFDKALEPTTLLAYEMNGEPLPPRHGYPLRLVVPGLFGEKSARWITRIEVLDRADSRLNRPCGLGFYQEQGWVLDDPIPIQSRIDAPEIKGSRFAVPFRLGEPAELRGMAFAGDRGISKVEISTDSGQTWRAAQVDYTANKLCWSLWQYTWMPTAAMKSVQIVVRATDATGKVQIASDRPPAPRGATGLHRVEAQVSLEEV